MKTMPYGSWDSPITSDLVAGGNTRYGDIWVDKDDIYWLETRPYQQGRSVIVRQNSAKGIVDVTPPLVDVRTKVHEYGGGSYICEDGIIYFSNASDQRLYSLNTSQSTIQPLPITAENLDNRYADASIDKSRNRLICVQESHKPNTEPVNSITSISLNNHFAETILVSGSDFYASPRVSPDGNYLTWVQWHHPNMPWDKTELWVANIGEDGGLNQVTQVAGEKGESICNPLWSPDNVLHYISDLNGWWNIYRREKTQSLNLTPLRAEFTQPQWILGSSFYGFISDKQLICAMNQRGVWSLMTIDLGNGQRKKLTTPFSEIGQSGIKVSNGTVVLVAGSKDQGQSIYRYTLGNQPMKLTRTASQPKHAGYLSSPKEIEFPSGDDIAYGFFYPPRNMDYKGHINEKPPLIVLTHGGPTGATTNSLNMSVQYWTSRGFAILDVNYRGSSGYGTSYRNQLKGNWGVKDVEDCVNGAKYLVDCGKVDADRLAIRGSSAGGYTTLACLTFSNFFKAGVSYYGISDLLSLAHDTHKFESRYLDSLIGPYPEMQATYKQRSPINHIELLSCPTILFQGLEDRIVPPSQAEQMVAALKQKEVPVAYLYFEDEQHGFRNSSNIKKALEAELYFYSRIFEFLPSGEINPIEIFNLS